MEENSKEIETWTRVQDCQQEDERRETAAFGWWNRVWDQDKEALVVTLFEHEIAANKKALKLPAADLDEFQCRSCFRHFCVRPPEKRGLDWDFGCPYGCDDAGVFKRKLHIELAETGDAQ